MYRSPNEICEAIRDRIIRIESAIKILQKTPKLSRSIIDLEARKEELQTLYDWIHY